MTETYKNLFIRDLGILHTEVSLFNREEDIWKALPGTTNSAGNLLSSLSGQPKSLYRLRTWKNRVSKKPGSRIHT